MNAVDGDLVEGSVGAGTGATVGKALGPRRCVKGGIGTSSTQIDGGIVVGAIVAVNAYGEVRDPDSGRTVAGPRGTDGGFVSTVQSLARGAGKQPMKGENTTIGVVATNARLDKEQANKLAQMAQDGVAATVRPAHGMGDGDVIFALATGAVTSRKRANVTALGAVAAEIVASAIFRGVSEATRLAGVPAAREIMPAE
jgi:L-aminopeptidase/D-esterase-like protein